jgi:hypothetical protein
MKKNIPKQLIQKQSIICKEISRRKQGGQLIGGKLLLT